MVMTKKKPVEKTKSASAEPAIKTRLIVHYDVGFNNHIYLRGSGANLSWEKGIKLKNIKSDEWLWETDQPFNLCEFKVLINDEIYEQGENHRITPGSTTRYSPKF